MLSLPDRIRALTGWQRWLLALALGALAVLALPPFHLLPVLLIAFPGLIWLIDASPNRKSAFVVGWWFGVGHFSVGLYWVANAFLVNSDRHAWLIPIALFALGAGMGLLPAMASGLARAVWRPGVSRVLVFSASWVLLEWVRGWLFTGFPWNLIGYVWTFSVPMLQVTALTGIYGLSLLTVLAASMPCLLLEGKDRTGRVANGAVFALLALVGIGGALRVPEGPAPVVEGVKLRLVQANIAQWAKWEPELIERHFIKQLSLSVGPGFSEVTHVIWPETSAFFSMDIMPLRRQQFALAAPQGGLIIGGAPRFTPQGVEPLQVWNSLFAVTRDAEVVGTFDKFHLVPFGEYTPLKGLLPLTKMTAGSTDFSAGPGPRTLTLPGLPPVSPLICYEVIFPGEVTEPGGQPEWMLNLTNDAWYGDSPGPYQHLDITRVRAVEEGLPLVRSAGTGVSAVIDPYGRTIASIPLLTEGVVDSPLPRALPSRTVYAKGYNGIALALIAACFGFGLIISRKNTS